MIRWHHLEIDKFLALSGMIIALIISVWSIVSHKNIVYSGVGILSAFSCFIWYFIRKDATIEIRRKDLDRYPFIVLAILFYALLTVSMLILYLRPEHYVRPLPYFAIISIMVGITALEIYYSPQKKFYQFMTLVQTIFIGVSVEISQMSLFPTTVGWDTPWHHMFVSEIISSNHIPSDMAYSSLPVFHLNISALQILTKLGYNVSSWLSMGAMQLIISVLIIFIVAKSLFNEKIASLAALLLSIGNYIIMMGISPIPNSLAGVFLVLICYVLVKLDTANIQGIMILIFTLMVVSVLTHTMGAVAICIALWTFWAIRKVSNIFIKDRMKITSLIPIAFFGMMISWWTYMTGHILKLSQFIEYGFDLTTFRPTTKDTLEYIYSVSPIENILNNMGLPLLFILSLFGYLYTITPKNCNSDRVFIGSLGMIYIAIPFLTVSFSLYNIAFRWWYFAQIFLSISAAVGLTILLCSFNNRLKPIILTISMIAIAIVMILSSPANIDNHQFAPDTGVRYANTEAEFIGASFIATHSTKPIVSDFDFSTNPSNSVFGNYFGVSYDRLASISSDFKMRLTTYDNKIIVIRNEIVNRPFRVEEGVYRLYYDPNRVLTDSGFSKTYNNHAIRVYV